MPPMYSEHPPSRKRVREGLCSDRILEHVLGKIDLSTCLFLHFPPTRRTSLRLACESSRQEAACSRLRTVHPVGPELFIEIAIAYQSSSIRSREEINAFLLEKGKWRRSFKKAHGQSKTCQRVYHLVRKTSNKGHAETVLGHSRRSIVAWVQPRLIELPIPLTAKDKSKNT